MAQLNIRIDDEIREEFDALAQAKGLNTSDLLRNLISQAIGRDEGRPVDATTPQSLSAFQRRQLALLHEVLANTKKLPEGEKDYHLSMVEVLTRGYTSEYYKTFQMIQPEMTARESALVMDILDMFDVIERSVERLTDEGRASLGDTYALRFRGFDFNNQLEGKLASYAHYLINDGKWTRLADRFNDEHERGNSHMPVLATYQRMLSVSKPIWEKMIRTGGGPNNYNFTLEELQQIREAWPYPRG